MASIFTFQALLFGLTTVAFFFIAESNGWCSQSDTSSCDFDQVCCSSECVPGLDCEGRSCFLDTDCGSSETCCDGSCSLDCYRDSTALILGLIFGSLIFTCLVSMCFFYVCRRRRTRHGGVIVGQIATTTTVTTTRNVTQPYPPYPGQIPPPYPQGYQYYPPPQYEQHQTAIPSPYNPGTMAANDQPPTYSAATQGRSGGVYNPKTSYGAIETPSAPPP